MFCPKCGTENPATGNFCRKCGTELKNITAALSGHQPPISPPGDLITRRGRRITYESAIKSTLFGVAFCVIAITLSASKSGQEWWYWMFIPAASFLARGIGQFIRLRIGDKQPATDFRAPQNQAPAADSISALPPTNAEPAFSQTSIYATGELIARPPSVTENTTKLLQITADDETTK